MVPAGSAYSRCQSGRSGRGRRGLSVAEAASGDSVGEGAWSDQRAPESLRTGIV